MTTSALTATIIVSGSCSISPAFSVPDGASWKTSSVARDASAPSSDWPSRSVLMNACKRALFQAGLGHGSFPGTGLGAGSERTAGDTGVVDICNIMSRPSRMDGRRVPVGAMSFKQAIKRRRPQYAFRCRRNLCGHRRPCRSRFSGDPAAAGQLAASTHSPMNRLLQKIPAVVLLADRQQRRIAAGRRGVDRERALTGEAKQVVRAAGLRAGAGEAFAAERLHADHRTDLVAVD